MANLQTEIQAAADEMVTSGLETGLQIAVRRHGHVVADVDSGLAVAVKRNGPTAEGLAAVTRIDRLIAEKEEHR